MKARILPPSEWHRLDVTQLAQIGGTMRPEDIDIAVVEDKGEIVSTMAILRVTHFESLWISPKHRGNAGMTRRLLKVAVKAAKPAMWAWGCSDTEHMADVIQRIGGIKVPVESYIIPLGVN
jgi:hypothetical protein